MKRRSKLITALLILILFTGFNIPVLQAAPPQQPEKASIGTFWYFMGNGGLIYAEEDAVGFAETLEDDGCTWPVDRNSEWNDQPNNNGEWLRVRQLEDGYWEVIDSVDIAYFVGHSGKDRLGIHSPIHPLWAYVDWFDCQWGDDEPGVKWVVLATCLAGHSYFSGAMAGVHLILGWQTVCDDAKYGPTFANYIKQGYTLKQAWFQTGEECEFVPGIVRIMAEDLSVADDHLKGYGSYADPSPVPDDIYYWWTHPVAGWQELYNWVAPDNFVDTDWEDEANAYNNEDPNYITGYTPDDNQNYSTYDDIEWDGWTEPLILTANDPVTIQGFRIIANKDNTDQIFLTFYNDGAYQYSYTITNWEDGYWRVIDFDGLEFTVDEVQIQFSKDSGIGGFLLHPAKVGEFDFWEAGEPGGVESPSMDGQGSSEKNDSDDVEGEGVVSEELTLGSTITQSIQMMGVGMIGRSDALEPQFHLKTELPKDIENVIEYETSPGLLDPSTFESIGNALGLNGVPAIQEDAYALAIENGQKLEFNTKTGLLTYSNPSQAFPTALRKPSLPSDREAIETAYTFLQDNGLAGDLIIDAVVTYDTQGGSAKGSEDVLFEWTIAKNIYFKKELNGLPLLDKTTVRITEDGIVSLSVPTFAPKVVDAANTKTVRTACRELSTTATDARGRDIRGEDIDVENIELMYILDQSAGLLVPYYVFNGKYTNSGDSFISLISALEE